ncbi:recombinase family protein [Alkalibacillus aidingensis]|uniref:recombinase family protein n=1 Tax=Alkalibacillus aidingensis TaxID=2747607 RepID=UPI00166052E5|nr:recombinase family protein [Alkalibacillus aidingensis]
MIYGYSRVSDESMNDESQIEELKKYGCDEIISEKITGVSKERKLNDLIEKLEPEDTVVVLDVTRFGRSAVQSLLNSKRIEEKDANLVIIKLGVDTRTPAGKMVFAVMSAFAEFERDQTKERQRRGIENAKAQGKHLGRPREWKKPQILEAIRQYQETSKTVKEICESTGVSRASLYRELKRKGITR